VIISFPSGLVSIHVTAFLCDCAGVGLSGFAFSWHQLEPKYVGPPGPTLAHIKDVPRPQPPLFIASHDGSLSISPCRSDPGLPDLVPLKGLETPAIRSVKDPQLAIGRGGEVRVLWTLWRGDNAVDGRAYEVLGELAESEVVCPYKAVGGGADQFGERGREGQGGDGVCCLLERLNRISRDSTGISDRCKTVRLTAYPIS
jgi:hypothetical protein